MQKNNEVVIFLHSKQVAYVKSLLEKDQTQLGKETLKAIRESEELN